MSTIPQTSFYSHSTGAKNPALNQARILPPPIIHNLGMSVPFGGAGLGAPLLGNIAGFGGYGLPFGGLPVGGIDGNILTPL